MNLATFAQAVTAALLAYLQMTPEQQATARMYIKRKIRTIPHDQ